MVLRKATICHVTSFKKPADFSCSFFFFLLSKWETILLLWILKAFYEMDGIGGKIIFIKLGSLVLLWFWLLCVFWGRLRGEWLVEMLPSFLIFHLLPLEKVKCP